MVEFESFHPLNGNDYYLGIPIKFIHGSMNLEKGNGCACLKQTTSLFVV